MWTVTNNTVGWTKNTQKWIFFPLLFPKDSESLKILDIQLREVGAKRPLNATSKINRQTYTQTNKQKTYGHFDFENIVIAFSPTWPSGPSYSSSRKVCLRVVCLSPSHAIFLRGRTGAERASSVDWCHLDLDLVLK
jgi:hypothetical protein